MSFHLLVCGKSVFIVPNCKLLLFMTGIRFPIIFSSRLVQSMLVSSEMRLLHVWLHSMVLSPLFSRINRPVGNSFTFLTRSLLVNIYHMFCSTRIVHLVSVFGLRDTPITARVWALLKYVLGKFITSTYSDSCFYSSFRRFEYDE